MAVDGVAAPAPILEAGEPPEARGLRRDKVRLMVSDVVQDTIVHARFHDLPRFLEPGDLIVVNTSGTLSASLPAIAADGERLEVHLSTRLPGGFWTIELRRPGNVASLPVNDNRVGARLSLPGGGSTTVLAPYPTTGSIEGTSRLWLAVVDVPGDVPDYLVRYGVPIRYGYVSQPWPTEMYQTVFVTEPGSAEMPSAGRPFTAELVTALVARGIQIAPLVLHTGVASHERHEPPYEEFYRVPASTAERINAARRAGRHVVAVGTTVVRAIETMTDDRGITAAGSGWTSLIVSRERPPRAVTSLITGLHEAEATHLSLIDALIATAAERRESRTSSRKSAHHLTRAYRAARESGYLWHEFGDSHLILGRRSG